MSPPAKNDPDKEKMHLFFDVFTYTQRRESFNYAKDSIEIQIGKRYPAKI